MRLGCFQSINFHDVNKFLSYVIHSFHIQKGACPWNKPPLTSPFQTPAQPCVHLLVLECGTIENYGPMVTKLRCNIGPSFPIDSLDFTRDD